MNRTKLATTFTLGMMLAVQALGDHSRTLIQAREQWSNVYGNKEVRINFDVSGHQDVSGTFSWRLESMGRTFATGEQAVDYGKDRPVAVQVRFQVPEPNEGVIIDMVLWAQVTRDGADKPITAVKKPLRVFPESPFTDREEWLKSLKIRLFDPEKKTAKILTDARIPYKFISNVDALPVVTEGVLIIGEGVSLREYRGLGKTMIRSAELGSPVLCLGLSAGDMPIPGTGASDQRHPERMSFRGSDIIREFDKRLDFTQWADGKDAAIQGIRLMGERGPVVGVTSDDERAWPWVEARFTNGYGKLVICGFGIMERWEAGPTARFLFAEILEYVSDLPREKSTEDGGAR